MTTQYADQLIPPDFDVAVECEGEAHWVQVRGGEASTRGHGEEGAALRALGGEPFACEHVARAVRVAPGQLVNADMVLFAARFIDPTRAINLGSHSRTAGHLWREPMIDAQAIPVTLRRLAVLRTLRETTESVSVYRHPTQQAADRAVSRALLGALRTVGQCEPQIRFDRGDELVVRRGSARVTISVPPSWLARVYAFELEQIQEKLVLDADVRRDPMPVVLLDVETAQLIHTEVSRAELLPGVRIRAEVRA
jgi:hypothetical protein